MKQEHDGDITPGMNSYYGDVVETVIQPPITKKRWGSSGIRWDEDCERCGRTGQVDNNTGLCRKCGGG